MRVLTASNRALLIECADLDEAMRMHRAWADVPGVIERVPGARTVLVRFDPLETSATDLVAALLGMPVSAAALASGAEVTIPVVYDGEDLREVAALMGISAAELVRRHGAARWSVAFSGFAPGFGYLVGDDPLFDVPRRASPRTRVAAGAVALAGRFSGVYPRESPGGWQLIGRTDAVLWDVHRDPPALLAPGTVVRFEAGTAVSLASGISDRPDVGRRALPRPAETAPDVPASPTRAIEVIAPGLQLLVQDLGRSGLAELAVPASGAADRTALRAANLAVGNHPGEAALEAIGPVALRFDGPGVAAVAGAVCDLEVASADGRVREVEHGAPFAVADGDELRVGPATSGLRIVIAVRGGIRMPAELASRSTDTLSGIGPAPLRAGDVVDVGQDARGVVQPEPVLRMLPSAGDLVELDITLGPRDHWFTPSSVQLLTTQEWLVTPRSDRVGIRLQGDVPLERAVLDELPSEGVADGAIQVPADGQPVLFGPDHPTTGGYPVIGALTDAARDLAGQLPPGVRIRFRVVSAITDRPV